MRATASTSSATRAGRSTCSATTSSSPASASTGSPTAGWPGSCGTSPTRPPRPTSGARWRPSAGRRPTCSGGAFNCGKGQPGQVAPVSHGCPSALFRGVRILNTVEEGGAVTECPRRKPSSAALARRQPGRRLRGDRRGDAATPTCAGPATPSRPTGCPAAASSPSSPSTAARRGGGGHGLPERRPPERSRSVVREAEHAAAEATPAEDAEPLVGPATDGRRSSSEPRWDCPAGQTEIRRAARLRGSARRDASRGPGHRPDAVRVRRARPGQHVPGDLDRAAAAARPADRAGRAEREVGRPGRARPGPA